MISYPIQFPRLRRKAQRPPQIAPTPPPHGNVLSVTGSYGDDATFWTFDRAVQILAGAGAETWGLFTLVEDGGEGFCVGVSGVQLSPTVIRVMMNGVPTDSGNGWFWFLTGVPPKVKTVQGGDVNEGGGDFVGSGD